MLSFTYYSSNRNTNLSESKVFQLLYEPIPSSGTKLPTMMFGCTQLIKSGEKPLDLKMKL